MTPRLATCLVAILLATVSAAGEPTASRQPDGDYSRYPVFYEAFPDHSLSRRGDDLELLRRGIVQLQHYPQVDVSSFAWERDSFTEYTWRMQMQELRFLLPAIASHDEEDRRLAWEWFLRWYAVHMVPEPETPRWGEPVSTAYRTLVLVYLLKSEEGRQTREKALLEYLRATILEHQRYLALPRNAADTSNHGFMTALALFETTRVFADSKLADAAMQRVLGLIDRAVSRAGVEREHSPAYHFAVLRWLDQMSVYVASLPYGDRDFVTRTRECVERMRRTGYFLQDHDGRLAPIGDTDSVGVADFSPDSRIEDAGERALFDPASGYAVYKGSSKTGDCRYVVFRIPEGPVEMDRHFHADALAVFFADAGEMILGDTGRYSYGSSPIRLHCLSPAAHNTLLSYPDNGSYDARAKRLVTRPADRPGNEEIGWAASLTVRDSECRRWVRIPVAGRSFSVVDSIGAARNGAPDSADVVMLWNLGVDVTGAERAPGRREGTVEWSLVTRSGRRVHLRVSSNGPDGAGIVEAREVRGQESPRLGWYAPAQGVLRPVTTLLIRVRRSPNVTITTRVEVLDKGCDAAEGPRER